MHSIFHNFPKLQNIDIRCHLKLGQKHTEKTQVSVLMPVYNHSSFFEKAISSALSQDYEGSYEIIVVDNNYEDDFEHVNNYEKVIIEKNSDKILYYKNESNIGLVANWNRCALLCNSDSFIFLHDDDELPHNSLSTLLEVKNTINDKRALILSSVQNINEYSKPITLNYGKPNTRVKNLTKDIVKMQLFDWFLDSFTNGGGCLHNKEAFIELGGYQQEFYPSMDYALYIKYCYIYGAYLTYTPTYNYRIAENLSSDVYRTCIDRDEFYRYCMLDKFIVPNFFLKRIISAKKRFRTYHSEIRWKGISSIELNNTDYKYLRYSDLIKKLYHYFNFK